MNGKWIYLAQRNPRLDRAAFVKRWLSHRTLGAPPAMGAEFVTADYAAVRGDQIEGVSEEYDAVGLFALRGLASIPTVAGFLKLDHIQADEKRFFTTTSENFSMFCAEKVVLGGDYTAHAVVQFLRRASGVSPHDFEQAWAGQGTPALAGLSRHVQNVVIAPPPPGFGYDGVAEFWFADEAAMLAAASPVAGALADWDAVDARNSVTLATDIIASRPRKA